MGPLTIGALIGAGSGLVNNIFGIGAQNAENKANMELAQYQWEKNVEMWNMQNQYNSPSSQMARYRAAGLNPNLVATQGSSGNATSIPQYQAPTVSKYQAKFDNILDNLMKAMSVRSSKADLTSKELQNEMLRQELTDHSAEIQQRALKRLHDRDSWAVDLALKRSQIAGNESRTTYQNKVNDSYDEQFRQRMNEAYLQYDFLKATLGDRIAAEWARSQNLINEVDFYETRKRGAELDNEIKKSISGLRANELFESNHWREFMDNYGFYMDDKKLRDLGWYRDVDGNLYRTTKDRYTKWNDVPGLVDLVQQNGIDFLKSLWNYISPHINSTIDSVKSFDFDSFLDKFSKSFEDNYSYYSY